MEVIEAIYGDGVLKPLRKPKLREHSKVKIKIIPENIDNLLNSLVIMKVEKVNYKRLKEAYYESL
ncbi:antitoxin family protein [Thermococcus sp.]|uniref:antitoxin family protein n=1 Tax=Thermococcus sp. TaxID=35749 RepID=UPI002617E842|nr:antitoxin family protein [Thermococcus sp.]